MSAEAISRALGGHRVGATWMARCPAHEDSRPSLALHEARDGKVLVRCHAGCSQPSVIAALRSLGLWARNKARKATAADRHDEPDAGRGTQRRTELALAFWHEAQEARGTLAEVYLRSRGLRLDLPSSLRFHRGLKHPSGAILPAMIALVTHGPSGVPMAIHRTFLACDGSAKAPVAPQRMMLGPCRGGAVRLGEAGESLMVGEGIETCLAAIQATGKPAWAALSTSGLRTLELPDAIADVVVLADGDVPGEAAARTCASRWKGTGHKVRIARPPSGRDFNDLLITRRFGGVS